MYSILIKLNHIQSISNLLASIDVVLQSVKQHGTML